MFSLCFSMICYLCMLQLRQEDSTEDEDFVIQWLSLLEAGCSTQCSVDARLASAQAVVHNARELLLDSEEILGMY